MKKKTKAEFDPFIGLDLTEELTKTFSDSLAREIDRQILSSLGYEVRRNKRRINKILNIFNEL
jgi:hypothetical protein